MEHPRFIASVYKGQKEELVCPLYTDAVTKGRHADSGENLSGICSLYRNRGDLSYYGTFPVLGFGQTGEEAETE